MMDIQWQGYRDLKIAPWASVYILKPDRIVLERSLNEYGWLQPIIVQKGTGLIIDGNVRYQVAGQMSDLRKQTKDLVPTLVQDCNSLDAMLMHLRLNRGRGTIVAKKMSNIVRDLIRSRKYSEQDLKRLLVMRGDEMDLMIDGSLIKARKISDHDYSRAWVPVEAPASITDTKSVIERPPNADR